MAGQLYWCYLLRYIVVILFTLFEESCEWTLVDNGVAVLHKSCNATLAFSVIYRESLEKCSFDCQQRSDCKLYMFQHRMKQCALIDTLIRDISFKDSEPTCIYAEVKALTSKSTTNRRVSSRCGQPNEIENATLLSRTTKVGTASRYMCKLGYSGVGNPKIACRNNGTWTPTNFKCIIAKCLVPDNIENAELLSTSTRLGSTARYKCVNDHLLIGNPEVTCQLNATWSSANFSCLYGYCPSPPSIVNAYLQSLRTLVGSTNRYICNQGYYALGNPEIYCHINATWTITNFSCEELCSNPSSSVPNAQLVSVEYSYAGTYFRTGTKLNYECNVDFQGEGNTTTNVCDANSRWLQNRVMCCRNDTVSYGTRCYRVYTTENVTEFQDAVQTCRADGLFLETTTKSVYNALTEKGKSPNKWMLYKKKKSALQASLVNCLKWSYTLNLTEADLVVFEGATYDYTRVQILENGWDAYCRRDLIHEWFPGEPNGQEMEDCILNGPQSNFKYIDFDCSFSDLGGINKEDIGYSCKYNPPFV